MRPWVGDGSLRLAQAMAAGQSILFEGAQGTLLDIDHGTYPFVTSSNASVGGACTGLGVGPRTIGAGLGGGKAHPPPRPARPGPGPPAASRQLAAGEPVYEMLPGWSRPTAGVRVFEDLPVEA